MKSRFLLALLPAMFALAPLNPAPAHAQSLPGKNAPTLAQKLGQSEAQISGPVEVARTPRVEARLVAERSSMEPGKPLLAALHLRMIPHWHTYWRNPGDSGQPTSLAWKLPDGFSAGPIQWPAPQRLPAGPLMNYGYEDEVFLPVELQVPAALPAGPVRLTARASWLVCNPEQCIPEDAELVLTLASSVPGRSGSDTPWTAGIQRAVSGLPKVAQGWTLAARGVNGGVELEVTPPAGVSPPDLAYFPYDEGKIENAARQPLTRNDGVLRLSLPLASQPVGAFEQVHGLLVSSVPLTPDGLRAVEIRLPVTGLPTPGPAAGERAGVPVAFDAAAAVTTSLWLALVFAFLGGVILNLMPCVLPIVSIKVLGFAQHRDARTHGLVYAAGVILSFLMLAGALLALKAGGAQLGWGFQLQSPVFVGGLAMLFFVIALNLSGVFEFGSLLPARLASFQAANAKSDAFFSGVLAVLVASPCTAPFMGAALGFALSESAFVALTVFAALGAGMALPYVLLSWNPGWLRWVPRPGPWMLRFRQLLAFPLYATVIWLAWVLGMQSGLDAVIVLAAALLLLALAAWLSGLAGLSGRLPRTAAALLAGLAIALSLPAMDRELAPAQTGAATEAAGTRASTGAHWEPYSAARIAELGAQGHTVFVDFTAAWCVTCQVNKRLVLGTPEVEQDFAKRGVVLMRADWTRRDEDITRALAALGRNGVPVYALYAPGVAPRLLPELLTRDAINAAIAGMPLVATAPKSPT